MDVRIQLLGPLRAWRNGDELDLGGSKQRAVLALLAIGCAAGQLVLRSELVDALWGERPPPTAANVIQTYLKHLRRVLEPDRPSRVPSRLLRRAADGYALELSTTDLDLLRFRRLMTAAGDPHRAGEQQLAADRLGEALALWHGQPLSNVALLSHHPKVVALSDERWAAVAWFGEAMLATGGAAKALPVLEEAAAARPLDEAAQTRLIRAYHALGQRGRAFAAYRAVHRRLSDELGVDPGPELAAAHEAMLVEDRARGARRSSGADGGRTTGKPEERAATVPKVVPARLPTAPACFAGRIDQLRRLDDLLSGHERQQPVVISGTAGVGKTALAVHWAHRVANRFPDGQLYVNLRGFDPTGSQMSEFEAVRTLLDALQVPPQRIPDTMQAQVGLYRSVVTGRRLLIVLDNARDPEQVRLLLPGSPGCLVLVTSRDQFTGLVVTDGVRPFRLDPLPSAEARELLERRLGAERIAVEPAAVEAIIDRCGGLPLALAIVAARAAVHPEFRLDVLAQELREGLDAFVAAEAITDVRVVFSWSYQALNPPAARLFRLLGLHPGPDLSASAAASFAGIPRSHARALLAQLTTATLLTERTPGRYAFHDLLRAYAAELVHTVDDEAERRTARHRMLDHYLHTAYAAARLLDSYRDPIDLDPPHSGVTPAVLADLKQAQEWLFTEHPVIVAAIKQDTGAEPSAHIWRLAWTLDTFFDRRGQWHDKAMVQHTALAVAERLTDAAAQARAHRSIGAAYFRQGRFEAGRTHLQRALQLCSGLGDRVSAAHCYHWLGLLSSQQHSHWEALSYKQRALDLYRDAGYGAGEAYALNAVGWSHAVLGDYQQALAHCEPALARMREFADPHGQALVWDSLGFIRHRLGDHRQAVSHYERALELLLRVGDRYHEADTLDHLGDTHRAMGNLDKACGAWHAALTILEELDNPDATRIRDKLATTGAPRPAGVDERFRPHQPDSGRQHIGLTNGHSVVDGR